ncbi:MAG: hypothetical protein ACI9MC_000349 [Kiritimatiellia bacterium]|jgi:hypothetical protein
MPLPHLVLPRDVRDIVKAQLCAEQHQISAVSDALEGGAPDDDASLFEDVERGFGRGVYVFDEAEARSRRLDMANCADPDRGPIALGPGAYGVKATVLSFEQG